MVVISGERVSEIGHERGFWGNANVLLAVDAVCEHSPPHPRSALRLCKLCISQSLSTEQGECYVATIVQKFKNI